MNILGVGQKEELVKNVERKQSEKYPPYLSEGVGGYC